MLENSPPQGTIPSMWTTSSWGAVILSEITFLPEKSIHVAGQISTEKQVFVMSLPLLSLRSQALIPLLSSGYIPPLCFNAFGLYIYVDYPTMFDANFDYSTCSRRNQGKFLFLANMSNSPGRRNFIYSLIAITPTLGFTVTYDFIFESQAISKFNRCLLNWILTSKLNLNN